MHLYCDLVDSSVSEKKALLCRDVPDLSFVHAAVVAYLVLLVFCAYKFTEARVAATFMYPMFDTHSGAASNSYLLLCSAHLMRVQQSTIYYYYY